MKEYDKAHNANPDEGYIEMHNGSALFWKREPAHGGRVYHSDEIGGGVQVWDTALVAESTLLEAIAIETGLRYAERRAEEQGKRESDGPEFPDGPESEGFEPGFEQRCGDK